METPRLLRVDRQQAAISLTGVLSARRGDRGANIQAKHCIKHLGQGELRALVVSVLDNHHTEGRGIRGACVGGDARSGEMEAKVQVLGTNLLTDEVVERDTLLVGRAEDRVEKSEVGQLQANIRGLCEDGGEELGVEDEISVRLFHLCGDLARECANKG